MLTSPFPVFSGGNTELTAGIVSAMLDQMRRQCRFLAAPPVEVRQSGDGWQIHLRGRRGLWALCGAHEGNGRYAWDEASLTTDGQWVSRIQGRSGSGGYAASETAKKEDVTAGTVIWLTPVDGAETSEDSFAFTAPLANPVAQFMWAKINDTDGTTYGWREVTFVGTGFVEAYSPRSATAGSETAAVEANGASVPNETVVLLFYDGGPDQTRLFEYGSAGDGGFWARLIRESTGAKYEAVLETPTGGDWTLSFDPGENPAPGTTAGEVTLTFDATAEEAEEALHPYTARSVTVEGDAGDTLTFRFTGNLSGPSGATLSATFALTYESEESESEETDPTPTFTQTEVGRELPYTTGGGRYAWTRLSAAGSGRLEADGSGGSVWPACLARDSRGTANVPEGSVVWVRPGKAGILSLETASADAAFDDTWDAETIEAHFEGIDNGDGTLVDTGVDFTWWGESSYWAELTSTADGDGLFDFRLVHLGGRDAITPTEDELAGVNPDFPATEIEDLRGRFLVGDHGYHDPVYPELSEPSADEDGDERVWVPTRHGGGEVTGKARDALGRTDFRAGTIVRVYPAPPGGEPEFWFWGSPTSFWALLGSETVTPGEYEWTEEHPPIDAATGLPREPRTGVASERNGVTGILPDTAVFVIPDGYGGHYFLHTANEGDEGRDCRLLYWTGGGTATVAAGSGDPDSDGREVAVRLLPADSVNDLLEPGHHVGFRPPGSDEYVLPVTTGYHSDRNVGYVSSSPQSLAGRWDVGEGGLVVTGTATAPTLTPPTQYWLNYPAGTYTSHVTRHTVLTSDGSLALEGGPSLIATGGSLDLRGAAWASIPVAAAGFSGTIPSYTLDGVTGTYTLYARGDGTPGSVTFEKGLFVSGTSPGEASALWSGTFPMKLSGGPVTVTVVNGVITEVT